MLYWHAWCLVCMQCIGPTTSERCCTDTRGVWCVCNALGRRRQNDAGRSSECTSLFFHCFACSCLYTKRRGNVLTGTSVINSFRDHINDKRNFKHLTIQLFTVLYKNMVRSHLDYCSSVWSPYTKKDIEALEKVQKRATKILPQLKHMNYSDRLKACKPPTLL